jgi:hypothetical protein
MLRKRNLPPTLEERGNHVMKGALVRLCKYATNELNLRQYLPRLEVQNLFLCSSKCEKYHSERTCIQNQ